MYVCQCLLFDILCELMVMVQTCRMGRVMAVVTCFVLATRLHPEFTTGSAGTNLCVYLCYSKSVVAYEPLE